MTGAEAIKKAAEMNGVSKKAIYQDILECIEEAQKNATPEIQAMWAAIPRKGNKITPAEFVEYVAEQVKLERQKYNK